MKNHLQLQHCFDFADALAGKQIVAVGIGPDRDAIVLAVHPDDLGLVFERHTSRSGASFVLSSAHRTYSASTLHCKYGKIHTIDFSTLDAAFPKIQPLADGGVLIVSPRCRYNSGAPDQNATIYDYQGNVVRRMVFGDGIQDVQVSRSQHIWVSYFDEGIFGNRGWYTPLGASGLRCLNTQGEKLWEFEPPDGFDQICDCYALNVAEDAVWACYYTDFPVVRITSNLPVQGWLNNIAGVRAMAATRNKVLLWGGYPPNRERCVVQTIIDNQLSSAQEFNITLSAHATSQIPHVIGRDSCLHFIAGTSWYQLDLYQLP